MFGWALTNYDSWWTRGIPQAVKNLASGAPDEGRVCRQHWRYDGYVCQFSFCAPHAYVHDHVHADRPERWTNDKYTSTLHRVISPVSTRYRYSVAFFNEGLLDQVISCIPTCLEPGDNPRYSPVVVEEHLRDRYTRSF